MASLSQSALHKISTIHYQLLREFHRSSVICLNPKWREQKKLTRNPNSFGPLTNFPDFSFKDGRPTPYGANQKRRIDEQRQQLLKIKKLVGEIDFAVERHEKMKKQIEEERQKILDSKLKGKGDKLIASGSKE